MSHRPFIVILASGTGTNLQAIIDAVRSGRLDAEIALVVSNRPEAKALERASNAGIPTLCLPRRQYPTREAFERRLQRELETIQPAAIILAGFDRLISSQFVRAYPNRILNIHPALLPAFPGLDAIRQALSYGAKVTGVTIHFIDEGVDTGPIVLQEAVTIKENDTEESLGSRVHAVEHRLYPEALRLFIEGRLKIDGRIVHII